MNYSKLKLVQQNKNMYWSIVKLCKHQLHVKWVKQQTGKQVITSSYMYKVVVVVGGGVSGWVGKKGEGEEKNLSF